MSKLIFAKLGIDPASDTAETSAVSKIEAITAKADKLEAKNSELTTDRDGLQKKLDKVEAAAVVVRKDRAKTLVEAAQSDGRIAPKDEETAKEFRDKIEAGDAFAEKMLSKLPKSGPDGVIVNAAHSQESGNKNNRIEAAQGKARSELGSNAEHQSIWDRAKEIDPAAFV